jgi:hypothetical protein
MSDVTDEALVRELAEQLAGRMLEQAAPGELPMFDTASQAYFANPKWMTGKDRAHDLIAFDTGQLVPLVTPVALVAATQVTQHIVDKFLKRGLPNAARGIRRLFGLANDAADDDAPPLSLTDEEWDELREIVKRVAGRSGVESGLAETIADAVIGQGRRTNGSR